MPYMLLHLNVRQRSSDSGGCAANYTFLLAIFLEVLETQQSQCSIGCRARLTALDDPRGWLSPPFPLRSQHLIKVNRCARNVMPQVPPPPPHPHPQSARSRQPRPRQHRPCLPRTCAMPAAERRASTGQDRAGPLACWGSCPPPSPPQNQNAAISVNMA